MEEVKIPKLVTERVPKNKWKVSIQEVMNNYGLQLEDTGDRYNWKNMIKRKE